VPGLRLHSRVSSPTLLHLAPLLLLQRLAPPRHCCTLRRRMCSPKVGAGDVQADDGVQMIRFCDDCHCKSTVVATKTRRR
jgi:hypothetical protein